MVEPEVGTEGKPTLCKVFVLFCFPWFSSFGECLRVINVEAHAAHWRMANAIIIEKLVCLQPPLLYNIYIQGPSFGRGCI